MCKDSDNYDVTFTLFTLRTYDMIAMLKFVDFVGGMKAACQV